MKKKETVIAIITIVIIILIGGFIYIKYNSNNNPEGEEPNKTQQAKELKNTCDIVIVPSTETIGAGEDLAVEVRMKNVRSEEGIGAILAKLVYDKSVFEQITKENFVEGEEWDAPEYNSQNENEGKLFTLTKTGENMTTENVIFTINMKVLPNAQTGNTTIKLSGIGTTDGENDIVNDDAVISITITE